MVKPSFSLVQEEVFFKPYETKLSSQRVPFFWRSTAQIIYGALVSSQIQMPPLACPSPDQGEAIAEHTGRGARQPTSTLFPVTATSLGNVGKKPCAIH